METQLTKEELIELSEATIDKLKLRKTQKLFGMLGLLAASIGSVALSKALGLDQGTVHAIANGAMIANGIIASTNVKKIFTSSIAVGSFKRGYEEFKRGEYGTNEEYYNNFLKQAWDFAKVSESEIKEHLEKKSKGISM